MVRREGSLYIYIYGSQGCCCFFEAGIYLTTLRSSARTQMAKERRATEPDWWVAARDVGTYSSRVLMPRATCRGQRGEDWLAGLGRAPTPGSVNGNQCGFELINTAVETRGYL